MEDRKDNPPKENAKLDTNGMCRGKSSIPHIEKDDNTSSGLRSTQSELYRGDVSCDLVELSSDDKVQFIDVKRKSSEKICKKMINVLLEGLVRKMQHVRFVS